MSRGKILKLSDMKDMHGSITLEYTGILYAGVETEKRITMDAEFKNKKEVVFDGKDLIFNVDGIQAYTAGRFD